MCVEFQKLAAKMRRSRGGVSAQAQQNMDVPVAFKNGGLTEPQREYANSVWLIRADPSAVRTGDVVLHPQVPEDRAHAVCDSCRKAIGTKMNYEAKKAAKAATAAAAAAAGAAAGAAQNGDDGDHHDEPPAPQRSKREEVRSSRFMKASSI
jgi:hypothetical protein